MMRDVPISDRLLKVLDELDQDPAAAEPSRRAAGEPD